MNNLNELDAWRAYEEWAARYRALGPLRRLLARFTPDYRRMKTLADSSFYKERARVREFLGEGGPPRL